MVYTHGFPLLLSFFLLVSVCFLGVTALLLSSLFVREKNVIHVPMPALSHATGACLAS